jgi:hypothetical protein
MLESGSSGSVRGVPSNGYPYRNPRPISGHPRQPQELAGSGGKRTSIGMTVFTRAGPIALQKARVLGANRCPSWVLRILRFVEGRGRASCGPPS